MTPRVGLRPATAGDLDFLVALRRRTMDPHLAAAGVTVSDAEHVQRVRARFDCAQIVLVDGTPAGLVKLARDGRQWKLIQIQIAPAWQGQGIGAQLLGAIVEEARRAGASIDLDVLKPNPARRLYERFGFVVIGEDAHSFDMRLAAPAGNVAVAPQALLFDVGGVLVEYDFALALAAWQPHSALPPDALRAAFALDAQHERFERGELDEAGFFAHLAERLQIDAGHDVVRRGWNGIFVGEIAATRALVEWARTVLPCYAFSNTNVAHMQAWSALFPDVVRAFDRIFMSHEIGRRKPERAAFEHVCAAIGVAPANVLFFDDLAENVAGALAAGLQAVHVRSPRDVQAALDRLGLVPAPRDTR